MSELKELINKELIARVDKSYLKVTWETNRPDDIYVHGSGSTSTFARIVRQELDELIDALTKLKEGIEKEERAIQNQTTA